MKIGIISNFLYYSYAFISCLQHFWLALNDSTICSLSNFESK